ncbi:MAG: hypothetical protein H6905_02765 [Hyphomicrobiales bacterium]|nr:hypothetical protein [Hyphomicrobiales bacterium]
MGRLWGLGGTLMSLLSIVVLWPIVAQAQTSPPAPPGPPTCARTITASVVVLDQPLMYNRLGASNVNAMIYALRRDVIEKGGLTEAGGGTLTAGNVELRPDLRPRPLVLRVAAGDCLTVNFENLLSTNANPNNAALVNATGVPFNVLINDQVATRMAGFHPLGLELRTSIASDASHVGENASSLVEPGQSAVYEFYAPKEGTFLVVNSGATFGSEGTGGNLGNGLFGAVNVQPVGANFYRSQVTEEEMRLATSGTTAQGHPIIDYEATYPNVEPWITEGKADQPILNMLNGTELVHADVNAIIVGTEPDGSFATSTYPLESAGFRNPTVPNRLEAFREFTTIFHDEQAAAQVFPDWFADPVLSHTLHGVRDAFMINYGSGGIGAEIIANRLGVGPMHDCLNCAYEEFFLSSSAVGDPAMLVDVPANVGLEQCGPAPGDPDCTNPAVLGPKATKAFYPADPANVHHSYTGDFVKFRNLHAGPKEQHIFHLHNHQWLFNANDDNSNYLDAQGIGPGSGYTYEINFGGSGNRNKSAGDAIFHCHFYPHFAQGMWELWRHHDVMETGTPLEVSQLGGGIHTEPFGLADGTPAEVAPGERARAYPDGEITVGTPIPALVPLPGKPMPPMPGTVTIVADDVDGDGNDDRSLAVVDRTDTDPAYIDPVLNPDGLKNPGFPFWIAGIEHTIGQRTTTPPLDMLSEAEAAALVDWNIPTQLAGGTNGGLPRHTLEGYKAGGASTDTQTRLDFSKVVDVAKPVFFPEEGTDIEKAVMAFHANRNHPSTALTMDPMTTVAGNFVTNGQRPMPGSPYHEPCIDDEGDLFLAGEQGDFFGVTGLETKGTPTFGALNPRIYKAAVIQTDVVLNKVGYHFPQQRIITLNEDVQPTLDKQRPPQPFVIRFNTFDCGQFFHTNLVPEVYELDDYQVRTPTDIIGQHIHLPKWDLTSADGSGNGWNYEDGTLSPGAVQERIHAINAFNAAPPVGAPVPLPNGATELTAEAHPFFGAGPNGDWLGARTTIQRWFVDPVVNADGQDRGLGVIFTHDHFGPSTHQQVGLYATVLIEPANSTWVHNETGVPLNTRDDGGPTSWQAAILTDDLDGDGDNDSFREVFLQYGDFQHAYEQGQFFGLGQNGDVVPPTADSFRVAINPSFRQQASNSPGGVFPDIVRFPPTCPGGEPRPCPEAISADDVGTLVVNYRSEPVGLRVYDPNKQGPDGRNGTQADGLAGDLAYALQTRTDRAIPELNTQFGFGDVYTQPLNSDVQPGDPFTPIVRGYSGDTVRVKIQSGATEHEHNATAHGIKWLQGGSAFGWAKNSGWRNGQNDGISEQFSFSIPVNADNSQLVDAVDYAWAVDAGQDGWWSGVWGVVRNYRTARPDLVQLPNNDVSVLSNIENLSDFSAESGRLCPTTAPLREYDVTAVLANDVLANPLGVTIVPNDSSADMHEGAALDPDGGTLVYNPRETTLNNGKAGPLHDPTGMMYVMTDDLEEAAVTRAEQRACRRDGVRNPDCPVVLAADAPIEPLTLRAAAGECIKVTLRNRLPDVAPDLAGYNTLLQIVNRIRNDEDNSLTTFQNNLIRPSTQVGLRPALVEYDVARADGTVVGINPDSTVAPGDDAEFYWYAGTLSLEQTGPLSARIDATPIEFGGANLAPADKIKQGQKGLVGALVIEPEGATWTEDTGTRTAATVTAGNGDFRDFVTVLQKGQNHKYADGTAIENIASEGQGIPEDSHDAGQQAINYGSEPLWFRFGLRPDAAFGHAGEAGSLGDLSNADEAYSNDLVGGDPVTPVFTATAGEEVRMRVLMPFGVGRGTTFNLHGHNWQRDPYVCPGSSHNGLSGKCSLTEVASRAIGHNPVGFTLGHQESVTPATHFDIVVPSAGGSFEVTGDYLYRDQASFGNLNGLWGIVRVE